MLAQRLWRRTTINPALGQALMLAGYWVTPLSPWQDFECGHLNEASKDVWSYTSRNQRHPMLPDPD